MSLQISEDHSNIVWSTTADHAAYLLSLSPEAFRDALNYALLGDFNTNTTSTAHSQGDFVGQLLSSVQNIIPSSLPLPTPVPPLISEVSAGGKRASFPLQSSHAQRYVKGRLALIGDAAHTIHPLAGQGVNIGLADVAALTRTLMKGLEAGTDIGDVTLLKEYEQERAPENVAMIGLMHALYNTFTVNFGPFNLLRSAGMSFLDAVSPVKNKVIEFAVGRHVDITGVGEHGQHL